MECCPPRISLLQVESPGHNTTNTHRKTLKGGKKKADSPRTWGTHGGEFPGFPFCLSYNLSGAMENPEICIVKRKTTSSKKSLFPPNKGPRKEKRMTTENFFHNISPTLAKYQWTNIPPKFSARPSGELIVFHFSWQPQGSRSGALIYPPGGAGWSRQGADLPWPPSRSRQCSDFPALLLSVGPSG